MHTDSGCTKFSETATQCPTSHHQMGRPMMSTIDSVARLASILTIQMTWPLNWWPFCIFLCITKTHFFLLEQHTHTPMSSLTLALFPIAPLPRRCWHHWHSCPGGRVAAAVCHGIVRVLLGWRWQGERIVVGVPWRFGVAVLQHYWQCVTTWKWISLVDWS